MENKWTQKWKTAQPTRTETGELAARVRNEDANRPLRAGSTASPVSSGYTAGEPSDPRGEGQPSCWFQRVHVRPCENTVWSAWQ